MSNCHLITAHKCTDIIRVWDRASGRELQRLTGHENDSKYDLVSE